MLEPRILIWFLSIVLLETPANNEFITCFSRILNYQMLCFIACKASFSVMILTVIVAISVSIENFSLVKPLLRTNVLNDVTAAPFSEGFFYSW